MSPEAEPTTTVRDVADLPAVEDYDFADSRFLFVQAGSAIFYTRVLAKSTMPTHAHQECHQFSFIVAGSGYVEIEGRRIEVNKGMCIRIPAGQSHLWHNPNDVPLEYLEVKTPARGDYSMIKFVKDRYPDTDDNSLGINV